MNYVDVQYIFDFSTYYSSEVPFTLNLRHDSTTSKKADITGMIRQGRSCTLSQILVIISMLSIFGLTQSFLRVSSNQRIQSVCIRSLHKLKCAESPAESNWRPDYSPYKKDFSHITDDQWSKLEALSLKLYDWNTKVNLVSRKDVEFLIPNHIIPCLSMSLIRQFNNGETVIDMGTGGGLPGLPLAIVCLLCGYFLFVVCCTLYIIDIGGNRSHRLR